ncbi:ExbD/TolR family protein [Yoonia sp. 2307UL14-13]|uniref:ExbD/TolR family protein n=1 Tax=Yoonia sp. 2307UL14-13 TaxID=3126506 RepID=UPI0030ACB088
MYSPSAIRATREKGEPTLPLINIVFLMLIFFLVTAQMARPLDPDIQLINTDDPAFVPPPDAIVIDAAGDITFRGQPLSADAVLAILQAERDGDINARILPDRRAPAELVISVAQELRGAGAQSVFIVTEQAL